MTAFHECLNGVGRRFEAVCRILLLLLIGAYRTIGTSFLGGGCRFHPSCSEYASTALTVHSPLRATSLILRRLSRCRPGVPCGFDPVPGADRALEIHVQKESTV